MSENEFEYEGVIYISKPNITCRGCAFDDTGGCGFVPNCGGALREDGTSVIFVEKPKSEEKIEMRTNGMSTMNNTEVKVSTQAKYDVSDKSKEYWNIICEAYDKQEAEILIGSDWVTANGYSPRNTIYWIDTSWRVKPKNRAVTLEIPEDLEIEIDLSDYALLNGNQYLTVECKEKEILEKILKAIKKS